MFASCAPYLHGCTPDAAAQQGHAHAVRVQPNDVVANGLEHVAVQLVHASVCWQQVGQRHNLVALLLAQQHVVAGVLAAAAGRSE